MNYDYSKMDYSMIHPVDCSKDVLDDNHSSIYHSKKHNDDVTTNKPDTTSHMKPSDVKNCDLVSLLLAATPPYLYNIPLVPQTFFFSEMLRSFVQAKTERQNLKSQQIHHRRTRKRTWREFTPPKQNTSFEPPDKPLELTTPRQSDEEKQKQHQEKNKPEVSEKRQASTNFTAEKLANSSINELPTPVNESTTPNTDIPAPPLWYPPLYPSQTPYGIDPLHFFIDLRVSAHIWDRKTAAEKEALPPIVPLNLTEKTMPILEPSLNKTRHNSAFSVPGARSIEEGTLKKEKGTTNMHYILHNIKEIFNNKRELKEKSEKEADKTEKAKEEREKTEEEKVEEMDEEEKRKKCKDLRALIGLELVVDYVKQESDVSEDEEEPNTQAEEIKEVSN